MWSETRWGEKNRGHEGRGQRRMEVQSQIKEKGTAEENQGEGERKVRREKGAR